MMMKTGTIEAAMDTAEVAMVVAEAEVTEGEAGVDTVASLIICRKATAMPTRTMFLSPIREEVSLTYLTTPIINLKVLAASFPVSFIHGTYISSQVVIVAVVVVVQFEEGVETLDPMELPMLALL